MTELKTLKDIIPNHDVIVIANHLRLVRKEAIKWINLNKKFQDENSDAVNYFIKHFFNITEENLK